MALDNKKELERLWLNWNQMHMLPELLFRGNQALWRLGVMPCGQKTLSALVPHPAGGTVFGPWGKVYPVTSISSPGRNRSGYLRSGLFCGKVLCGMFLMAGT